MIKQILTISMMLLGALAWGQNFTVSGRVEDGKSHEAMPFTNVALLRTADSVFMRGGTTDDKGVYTIRDVGAGDYLLKVAFAGYDTYWQAVSISGDTELPLISLSTSAIMLEGVQITAERPLFSMDGEKMLYNTEDDPSVQSGTAVDALRSAPDVEVDAAGNISMRGVGSVEIWINGKPSHMSGETLKQYLKTLPASSVKRIEVITNPSARYKSSGGVINLVTDAKVQVNDFLSMSLNGNTIPEVTPWFTYVRSRDKLRYNLYCGPYLRTWPTTVDRGYKMFDTLMQPTEEYTLSKSERNRRLGLGAGFTLNYDPDTLNSFFAWGGGWYEDHQQQWNSDATRLFFNPERSLAYTDSSYRSALGLGGYGGIMWSRQLDDEGQELQVALSGYFSKDSDSSQFSRLYSVGNQPDYGYINQTENLYRSAALELDYTKPLNDDMDLEAGASVEYTHSPMWQRWDSLDLASGLYGNDRLRSFNNYQRVIEPQAYVTYTYRPFDGFNVKLGLRAEERYCQNNYPSDPEYDMTRNDFNLVPSIHLSYRTKNNNNFKLNYTRRYDAPEGSQFSPYRFYNVETIETGNPALLCSYTHNVEAGWTRFIKGFGSVGIDGYYNGNTNEIESLDDAEYDLIFGRYVPEEKPLNVGNSHTLGATANVTYRPNAMLNIRLYASLFDNYYRAQFRPDEWTESEMLSYRIKLSAWTKLWKKLDIFCNATYLSPTQSLLAKTGEHKSIDLGLSADFFQRKLSLYLSVNDIFNWNARDSQNTNPYYTVWTTDHMRTRYLRFGLTYRLGKLELERMAKQGQ